MTNDQASWERELLLRLQPANTSEDTFLKNVHTTILREYPPPLPTNNNNNNIVTRAK